MIFRIAIFSSLDSFRSGATEKKRLNLGSLSNPIIKITAEVNNVFNQDYEVVLNYPMPGINFRLTVGYELF